MEGFSGQVRPPDGVVVVGRVVVSTVVVVARVVVGGVVIPVTTVPSDSGLSGVVCGHISRNHQMHQFDSLDFVANFRDKMKYCYTVGGVVVVEVVVVEVVVGPTVVEVGGLVPEFPN